MMDCIVAGQTIWGLLCSDCLPSSGGACFLIDLVFKGHSPKMTQPKLSKSSLGPSLLLPWPSVEGWPNLSLWGKEVQPLGGLSPCVLYLPWLRDGKRRTEFGKSRSSGFRRIWESQLEHSTFMRLWISGLNSQSLHFLICQNGENKIYLPMYFGGPRWQQQLYCLVQT